MCYLTPPALASGYSLGLQILKRDFNCLAKLFKNSNSLTLNRDNQNLMNGCNMKGNTTEDKMKEEK
jgi:hypothetical protein